METDSEELLKYGTILAQSTWKKCRENLNLLNGDFNLVLTHQVGVAHEKLSLDSLELNNHKTYKTYPELGNTGSSALPITLMKAFENDFIKSGDKIALLGIGSGLSSIMLGVEW
jgi:3-oxoacyl-[acyl-carrier-protein] synthase-3